MTIPDPDDGPPASSVMRRPTFLSLLFILLACPAGAQTIVGRVFDGDTRQPLVGAWLVLMDSAGAELGGYLSNAQGGFVIKVPHPGPFRVRAQDLGHADALSAVLTLRSAERRELSLTLPVKAISLAGITVESERHCTTRPAEGEATATLWQEARKVLSAVQWTGREHLAVYRLRRYQRVLDYQTGRVLQAHEDTIVSGGGQPFTTPPATDLAQHGFVQEGSNGPSFYAPDASVLLSNVFADTHCFRVRRGGGEESGMVGLEFEPSGHRDVPDVRGTLWLDSTTAALRFLEFHYTGIDYGPRTRELGGRLDFTRLPTGAWITERWRIRGPQLARQRAASGRQEWRAMVGFREAGGQVVGGGGGRGSG